MEAIRKRLCALCGVEFAYSVGSGKDRKYCGPACRGKSKKALAIARLQVAPKCSVSGCESHVSRISAELCEKHYCRLRRTGTLRDRVIRGFYRTKAGYIKLLQDQHPLSGSAGHVAEHRWVMYEITDGKCPSCYWCGKELEWGSLVIDHLNEVKHDNNPDNLLPSCNTCNRARGAMIPFIQSLTADGFALWTDTVTEYKSCVR